VRRRHHRHRRLRRPHRRVGLDVDGVRLAEGADAAAGPGHGGRLGQGAGRPTSAPTCRASTPTSAASGRTRTRATPRSRRPSR
jgi:hypothetical protein